MSAQRDEQEVDFELVWQEHLAEVNEVGHWTYLVAVLVGGTVLMLVFIALLAGVR